MFKKLLGGKSKGKNYPESIDLREEHYERFLGPINKPVFHSTDLKFPHIDIYQFEPHGDRNYWTLITGGMSDAKQNFPDGKPKYIADRAEILMYVREPQGWMFNVLKGLAEMPFDDNTFLHWWHTVPNGKPMTAKPSLLTNFFFLPPYFEQEDFNTMHIDGDRVDFLWLIPITDSELQYKREHGGQALEDLMSKIEMSPIVNEDRQSII